MSITKKLLPEQYTFSSALSIAIERCNKAYNADLSWEEWEKLEKAEKLEKERRLPRGEKRGPSV